MRINSSIGLLAKGVNMYNGKIFFSVVSEHKELTDLYLSAELEISQGWEEESGVFFSEAALESDGYNTANRGVENDNCFSRFEEGVIAAYSLSKRHGVTVLDYIAVKKDLRKSGIGSVLLDRIKERCKKDGVEKIYLTAKAKGFFLKNGARELPKNNPLFKSLLGECCECAQREKECFPVVMAIDI